MKSQMTTAIALSLLLGAGIARAETNTVPAPEVKKEEKAQLKEDRKERNEVANKVKEDKQKLESDKKSGASKEVLKADRKALKKDRQARHEKQEKVNADKKELGLETKKDEKKSE